MYVLMSTSYEGGNGDPVTRPLCCDRDKAVILREAANQMMGSGTTYYGRRNTYHIEIVPELSPKEA